MDFKYFFNKRLIESSKEDLIKKVEEISNFSKMNKEFVVSTSLINKLPYELEETAFELSDEYGDYLPKETKKIKIKELFPTQDFVYKDVLLKKIKYGDNTKPLVAEFKNNYFILDGHHKIILSLLSGDNTIDTMYFKVKK